MRIELAIELRIELKIELRIELKIDLRIEIEKVQNRKNEICVAKSK